MDNTVLPYRPGVGIMLLNAHSHVFVGRRIDAQSADPSASYWQMPQGGIDGNETPEEAMWRELEEEVGTRDATLLALSPDWLTYDLPPSLVFGTWKGRYRGQRQRWALLRFQGDDTAINIATAHPEFDAWQWVPPHTLPTLIVPFKRPLYEAVLALFADYLPPTPSV
jgi:putative (di)nucleoside polyphosphate hydrolase